MNRTLLERVRCMLSEAKLPTSFWTEALKMATYIINRSPSKSLNGEMSEKIWSVVEPSYDHLQDITFVDDETIEDIGKKTKSDTGWVDKVSVKVVRLIPLQDEDNGLGVVENNN
ncbi:hypothetical protein Nepgr_012252 [Nepenthes gracilis]|uniref:Uncharacterized protein n=1 Tax=Nepenthes gracilis TaxID=150966 RepID=A0AAD3XN45_NEPGR|nr:hypothetical protein Nepgr_012252 [Nepenthes gracilis]